MPPPRCGSRQQRLSTRSTTNARSSSRRPCTRTSLSEFQWLWRGGVRSRAFGNKKTGSDRACWKKRMRCEKKSTPVARSKLKPPSSTTHSSLCPANEVFVLERDRIERVINYLNEVFNSSKRYVCHVTLPSLRNASSSPCHIALTPCISAGISCRVSERGRKHTTRLTYQ